MAHDTPTQQLVQFPYPTVSLFSQLHCPKTPIRHLQYSKTASARSLRCNLLRPMDLAVWAQAARWSNGSDGFHVGGNNRWRML